MDYRHKPILEGSIPIAQSVHAEGALHQGSTFKTIDTIDIWRPRCLLGGSGHELKDEGNGDFTMAGVTERRTELKRAFEQAMGYWNPVCDQVLDASPDWFESWVA